ncbi:HD-GYP domain-containing protein [Halopseudomonas salegens]|uniref:HD-GYP domain, c-di-GMP phosphodiesterase class II (Or its inactivated variant) n=1 Tax=Halopseudomonas salegens TaxID=1434072 RepID=A0A1H2G4W3_9GAMM|nr:HD domain-containing phosphohydrolase [Halopseudomonas salegens]SDU14338.1 HD-GYP domain, c-di-GMP phosphodiesterase class II (or its inactivated variant) [Halopseudomonas salegens]
MNNLDNALDVATHLSRLTRALSSEHDAQRLLDQVVESAMDLLNSDGGTLYIQQHNHLHFHVLRNRSLGLDDSSVKLAPIPLDDLEGSASRLVVVRAFKDRETIVIDDAYQDHRFDLTGTRQIDRQLNYRSRSFICVPLKDNEDQVIGVLQLINALDADGQVVAFRAEQRYLLEALGAIAATILTQRELINAQKTLFESFIKLIAEAIDYKSPVTGRHCQKVPEIAMLLADAVCDSREGAYADVAFNEQQLYELKIAAWLHDCGKITTPEAIIDKGRKLEQQFDRIELVASRVREYQSALLLADLRQHGTASPTASCKAAMTQADADLGFMRQINLGGEQLDTADLQRLEKLAEIKWCGPDGRQRTLLSEDELANLSIRRGTLLPEELAIMRDHIVVTNRMLHSLPYPRNLQQVPEIAGNHHEHLDGSGYPRKLSAEQLCVRARIMAIADIFEALTAPDRPYKQGMPLSQALSIIGRHAAAGRLDAELFTIFVRSGAYLQYARRFMSAEQIDQPDLDNLPGLLR